MTSATVRVRALLGLVAVTLVLFAGVMYAFHLPARQKEQGDWVTHTYEVLSEINSLDLHLSTLEAAERAYKITRNGEDLAAGMSAASQINSDVTRIGNLTADNPRQQARLSRLRPDVSKEVDAFNATLLQQQPDLASKSSSPAERHALAGSEVENQLDSMRDEEESLLESRLIAWDEAAAHTRTVFFAGGLMLIFLGGAWYLAISQASRRNREAAVMQKRLAAIEHAENMRLARIVEIQRDIAGHVLDLDKAMQSIATHACSLSQAEGSIVEMLDGADMVYRAASGTATPHIGLRLKAANSLSGLCLEKNSILSCVDSETDDRVDRQACRKVGLRSMVVVPLRHHGDPVGVLKVLSSQVGAFRKEDTASIELMAGVLSATLSDASAAAALQTANRALADKSDQLEKANAQLEKLATTDGLTGLRNRRTFQELLTSEFERARRYQKPLSLALMDVDHFKQFNDTFGHPAGDAVLERVGAILQANARATDCAARYGGEEFVLLLPETPSAGAAIIAERVREAIAASHWDQRPITVSIGVSSLPAASLASPEALLEAADQALYASKREGRNRVTLDSVATA